MIFGKSHATCMLAIELKVCGGGCWIVIQTGSRSQRGQTSEIVSLQRLVQRLVSLSFVCEVHCACQKYVDTLIAISSKAHNGLECFCMLENYNSLLLELYVPA